MSKYLRNKLKQNKLARLCFRSVGLFVLMFMISLFNTQVVNAASNQAILSVNVRVVGTCNISITSGQSLTDQVINSQCNDKSQGFTETDKLDFFDSSKSVTESFSDEGNPVESSAEGTSGDKKKASSDGENDGKNQGELGVGRDENIRANIKTVKTVLFEG